MPSMVETLIMGASPERTMTWSYPDNASRATINAWPVPRCSACTTKLTRVCSIAVRTRSASWPMIANTSLAGTTLAAARITCSRTGLPPTSCSTLGICDFSRVPLPAAIIATAMRGTKGAPDFDDRFDNRFTDAEVFNLNFAFNFFIRISIYLDYLQMAISSKLAYNLAAWWQITPEPRTQWRKHAEVRD